MRTAHCPAHQARGEDAATVAAALGLNIDDTGSVGCVRDVEQPSAKSEEGKPEVFRDQIVKRSLP